MKKRYLKLSVDTLEKRALKEIWRFGPAREGPKEQKDDPLQRKKHDTLDQAPEFHLGLNWLPYLMTDLKLQYRISSMMLEKLVLQKNLVIR